MAQPVKPPAAQPYYGGGGAPETAPSLQPNPSKAEKAFKEFNEGATLYGLKKYDEAEIAFRIARVLDPQLLGPQQFLDHIAELRRRLPALFKPAAQSAPAFTPPPAAAGSRPPHQGSGFILP